MLDITPSGQACGASVRGVDLSQPLDTATIAAIRQTWLEHHVLAFPDQDMSDDDLERFTLYFGDFGDDPFIAPLEGREHVLAICRGAHETAPLFAENWHTDWSFQERPPAGTCLYGITIPPHGGDTLFCDQHKSLAAMAPTLRAKLEGKMAIHSAQYAYGPEGSYGEADQKTDRMMDIRPSTEARACWSHPLIRAHPETGEEGLFGTLGYIIGIEGMEQAEAWALLGEVQAWQGSDAFCYRHKWQKNMLIMWDNRSVLHCATGGYEGYERMLHRTTIAAWQG